ncbi:MAG: plasmid mobilization protein [Flavisolibacter sp.]
MENSVKEVRHKMVVFRLSRKEYEGLVKLKSQTTERSISDYLRKLALGHPVTVKYRNATADDFLREMLELKKELHAIGNNYNQAVKKLHILERLPEFRNWILLYEDSRDAFVQKVNEIESKVTQLYELWLQK